MAVVSKKETRENFQSEDVLGNASLRQALTEDLLVPSPFTAVLPSLKAEDTLRRNLTSGPLLLEGIPSSPHLLTSLLLLL